MSDLRRQELYRQAFEGDPTARLALFRSHTHAGCHVPGVCSICSTLVAETREWFSKWAMYLTDPIARRMLEGRAHGGNTDELRKAMLEMAKHADYYHEVMRHLLMQPERVLTAPPAPAPVPEAYQI